MTHPHRKFKDAIYEQLARVGKCMASETRLELLDLLCQGARTVEALAREAGQSVANTSKNLRLLHAARLVDTERRGSFVTYRPACPEVADLFRSLRRLAETRLTEIDAIRRDFLESKDLLEPVDREGLVQRVRDGEVLLLDVRPREEYRQGHIRGALSAPIAELENLLRELPTDGRIVAYCRGPDCVMSIEAVRLLRNHGFAATRLEDGPVDWPARGYAVVGGGSER